VPQLPCPACLGPADLPRLSACGCSRCCQSGPPCCSSSLPLQTFPVHQYIAEGSTWQCENEMLHRDTFSRLGDLDQLPRNTPKALKIINAASIAADVASTNACQSRTLHNIHHSHDDNSSKVMIMLLNLYTIVTSMYKQEIQFPTVIIGIICLTRCSPNFWLYISILFTPSFEASGFKKKGCHRTSKDFCP